MEALILIRGPLGVGKSTVARMLAAQFDCEYISIDEVLVELGLNQVEGEGIPVRNFLACSEHVLPSIRRNIEAGKPVIIDGNFYHAEHVGYFLSHFSNQIRIFTLKASVETCIHRDSKRKHSYGKDAAQAVHTMVSRFDSGTVIDTEHMNSEDVVATIMQLL